jgi:hypothetical protein
MKRQVFLMGVMATACSLVIPAVASSPLADSVDPQVKQAMALLKQKTADLGAPSLKGTDTVSGQVVPVLRFGNTAINNNEQVVDAVRAQSGGGMTATLFARKGDNFIRVATNVPSPNVPHQRAVGTLLDPKGPVITKIRNGDVFYGRVSILGTPYISGYEPIKSASGDVIGIYYVGYKAPAP